MKAMVCGSRTWTDRRTIARRLLALPRDAEVIHGAAVGADRIASEIAKAIGLSVTAFPADWVRHGKAAGPIRNREMLDQHPDVVLAFWDGKSTGTKDAMDEAERRRIRVICHGEELG